MKTKVSVIIPSRIEENIDKTIEHILKCDYSLEYIEIYNVNGQKPSKQRNECIKISNGDIVYFIDNDSIVEKNNISNAINIFESDSSVAVVGGPALHSTKNLVEEDINICLSSYLCVGPISSRYTQKNSNPTLCNDKSLILCNMFIRKDVFNKIGYFNENLYPNEENELIDRIISNGYKIIYHPNIVITREPRQSISEYIKMLVGYGIGRAEQMREHFLLKNIIFASPMFFLLYVISIPIVSIYILPNQYSIAYTLPLQLYTIVALIFALQVSIRRHSKKIRSFFIMIIMFAITHFSYGFGFVYGVVNNIFKNKNSNKHQEINIKKIKSFDIL